MTANTSNSCGPSGSKSINIKVSELKQGDNYNIQLFPNPSRGEFYLNVKSVQDKWLNVEVLSMSGQLLHRSRKKSGINDYSQLINLDKMAPGIYAVKIVIDDKVYTKQVLIIR